MNSMFSQVKVDEGSNLEHVTRSRPKGNRNRRPPTRIHMKEVCVCAHVRIHSSVCNSHLVVSSSPKSSKRSRFESFGWVSYWFTQ